MTVGGLGTMFMTQVMAKKKVYSLSEQKLERQPASQHLCSRSFTDDMKRNHQMSITRVTRSKSEAEAAYDRMSRWYDLLSGNKEQKITEIGLKMLDVHDGDRVLEIGFGTGNSILKIARKVGESGMAYGLDISTGMVEVTRKKLDKLRLSQRVELKVGDATMLPYNLKTFDAIFMSFTLELFDTPEIPVVLEECKRVLRNDGRICIVAMSKKGDGIAVSFYEWGHRILPKYIDCRPIYLMQVLEGSGFKIITSKIVKMWRLPIEIALARL